MYLRGGYIYKIISNMSLNVTNVELDFNQTTDCSKFLFTFSSDLFKDNIGIYQFGSFILTVEDSVIDITSSVFGASNGGTVNCTYNSTTITGNATTFITDYGKTKYIQLNGYVYEIAGIAANTQILLSTPYKQPTGVISVHSQANNSFYVNRDIVDGYNDVKLDINTISYGNVVNAFVEDVKIFSCHAQCCLTKMFLLLPSKMCSECDFEDYISDLMLMQSLVEGVQLALCCSTKEASNKVFANIKQICEYNHCDPC